MLDYYKKMELENQLEVYRNLIAKYQEYKKMRSNIKYMNLLPISTSYLIELINENKQILDSLDFELKTRIRCYTN